MKIAVLTSGGDAPGMNAAVRAVARTAFSMGWQPMKIEAGYKGLLVGRLSPMDRRRLGGIIGRGGTVLGTQRSEEFRIPGGQRRAVGVLEATGVEGLVMVRGRGEPRRGARARRARDQGGGDTGHHRQRRLGHRDSLGSRRGAQHGA